MTIGARGLAFTLNRIDKRTTWEWRGNIGSEEGRGIREKTEMLLMLALSW